MRSSFPRLHRQSVVPRMLEAYLLACVKLDAGDTETVIPPQGSLVTVFAPHSGWVEPVVIDGCFRRVRRAPPSWVTKAGNRALPSILVGSRLICIDREHPEPSVVRTMYETLERPNGALATAIEGTRFGNPRDPEDLLTLGPFKSGLVRIAIRAQVPMLPVVVLGAERVAPYLERAWQERGIPGAFGVIRWLRSHPQPVEVRFLPVYRDHLRDDGGSRGRRLREKATLHTSRLRTLLAAKILELDPDYPLGG